jgi:uncharacterized protein (TIGR04255 family)
MNLGKPPIVQVWIEFRFDRGSDGPEWGLETANRFFEQIQEAYPEREQVAQHHLKIEKVEKNQRPRIIDERLQLVGMRAFTMERNRCIQLVQNVLTCNFARTQSGYEGFDALKTEALATFGLYVDFFRPSRLLQAVIHYVDLVRIPFVHGHVPLADYFTFAHDLPETGFGTTLGLDIQYTARPAESKDLLEVRLYSEQPDPEGPKAQFRMEWRLMILEGLTFGPDELAKRLYEGHDTLLRCFKNSFTEKGWALFEPKVEG